MKLNGCIIDEYGNKSWYKDGIPHREDGPASEWANGNTIWFFNGEWLGWGYQDGFWKLWDRLTVEQRGNPSLLRWLPR